MSGDEKTVGAEKVRVARERFIEQSCRLKKTFFGIGVGSQLDKLPGLNKKSFRDKIDSGGLGDGGFLARRNLSLELIGDCLTDFTLDSEDVGQIPIVGLRPKMRIGAPVNELGVDADPIAHA